MSRIPPDIVIRTERQAATERLCVSVTKDDEGTTRFLRPDGTWTTDRYFFVNDTFGVRGCIPAVLEALRIQFNNPTAFPRPASPPPEPRGTRQIQLDSCQPDDTDDS